ncbi:MAG: cytochrome c3 family protein [Caldimicrobium sp.]|nr:cytochrome c3 family protein [Caldimicrobium sp.]MDW8182091.1 cytochrome c3 family protein [Caldimicrobium sp.]
MFPLIVLVLTLFLTSCKGVISVSKEYSCRDCHRDVALGEKHSALSCRDCHSGIEPSRNKREAHLNLKVNFTVRETEELCKRCHQEEATLYRRGHHYRYEGELKAIQKAFGINLSVRGFQELVDLEGDHNSQEGILVDFLKRRCLTCHIWSKGEDYPKTRRERGCFSCHPSHQLAKSSDEVCLACHYSTRVGWDYYGYFPHNWASDYRSPFVNGQFPDRPYGIEAYHLTPDVHKIKGLKCSDCHTKEQIMYGAKGKVCKDCHANIDNSRFHSSNILQKIRCEACHAKFISKDDLKICSLEFQVEAEKWENLIVQESKEIEEILTQALLGVKVNPIMKDKFTEKPKEGLWLCSLSDRNFWQINFGIDDKGRICLTREETIYIKKGNIELRGVFKNCKLPHTIGRGDLNRAFWLMRERGLR